MTCATGHLSAPLSTAASSCSTLAPSTGEVRRIGRVSALLELGSGFNPEFTGRENVVLNATLLGSTREELEARMESIIDFAEIGDFFD